MTTKKILTIGTLLIAMIMMPSNASAQRLLERVTNTLERVNQALEQTGEETATTDETVIETEVETAVEQTEATTPEGINIPRTSGIATFQNVERLFNLPAASADVRNSLQVDRIESIQNYLRSGNVLQGNAIYTGVEGLIGTFLIVFPDQVLEYLVTYDTAGYLVDYFQIFGNWEPRYNAIIENNTVLRWQEWMDEDTFETVRSLELYLITPELRFQQERVWTERLPMEGMPN